ncbi:MAG: bifunctional oligoribonuclease/PAP phosphatase NrnA [Clostridia bacterium]|nr:bifunctional oligoribonuclease/PAP phosphatase NrnA [Clostridia bacterium]
MSNLTITLDKIPELLLQKDKYVIVCHRKPDGDTLGSALALLRILELMGKSARVVCSDPVPKYLQRVFNYELSDDAVLRGGEYVITVDIAEGQLFGRIFSEVTKKGVYLKIDHHLTGESFAEYNYVDPDASSVGEIIYTLAEIMGYENDPTVARSAFVAISTDTGGFKYSNTKASTYLAASKIAEVCAEELPEINMHLFETKPLSKLIANAVAVDYMRLAYDDTMAYVVLDDATKVEEGIVDEDLDEVVALFRQIEGVVVSLLIRQIGEDKYRVSARSKPGFDCAGLCMHFGGGGHMFAAGCNVCAPSAEKAEELVIAAAGEYFYEC